MTDKSVIILLIYNTPLFSSVIVDKCADALVRKLHIPDSRCFVGAVESEDSFGAEFFQRLMENVHWDNASFLDISMSAV